MGTWMNSEIVSKAVQRDTMPANIEWHTEWHTRKKHINKKPNRINQLCYIGGGETGIRTLGGIAATIDFESIPFGHSGISPRGLTFTGPDLINQLESL